MKLKKVATFATENDLTEAQVRWWIFNEASNGMKAQGVVKRIGRRVYIDPVAFERWVEGQQAVAA